MPHQHPGVAAAWLCTSAADRVAVYAWPAGDPQNVILLRDGGDGIWSTPFTGAPLLGRSVDDPDALAAVVREIVADLGARGLYFKLCYDGTGCLAAVRALPAVASWQRRPTCVVDWSDRGATLLATFRRRAGGAADRKLRRWTALGARRLTGEQAVTAVRDIERRSWKRGAGLDLETVGQLDYYAEVLHAGLASVTVAALDGQPIAYRLDMRHATTAFLVEWSFDADFGRWAPGVYLNTVGLVDSLADQEVSSVDLFGASDLLKAQLSTGTRGRTDVFYPAGPVADAFRRDRHGHDDMLRARTRAGVGVRATYTGGTG